MPLSQEPKRLPLSPVVVQRGHQVVLCLQHTCTRSRGLLLLPFGAAALRLPVALLADRLGSGSGSGSGEYEALLDLLGLLGLLGDFPDLLDGVPFTTGGGDLMLRSPPLYFLLLGLSSRGSYSGSLPSSLSYISEKDRFFLAALGVLRRTDDDDLAPLVSSLGSSPGSVLGVTISQLQGSCKSARTNNTSHVGPVISCGLTHSPVVCCCLTMWEGRGRGGTGCILTE